MSQRMFVLAISLSLVLAVAAVFAPVRDHALVDFDDYIYLRDNPRMNEPLDSTWLWRNINEPYAAYWIPLTWLSYRIGVAVHGPDASGHLLVNVGLHAINSVLLFFALFRMTRLRWRCAFVAAVFAVHPLHVESVAWASERKGTRLLWDRARHPTHGWLRAHQVADVAGPSRTREDRRTRRWTSRDDRAADDVARVKANLLGDSISADSMGADR